MNPLDLLLRDELNRLLDRIAVSTRAGVAKVSARQLPDLRARLDEAEERLAARRETLLKEYAGWGDARLRDQLRRPAPGRRASPRPEPGTPHDRRDCRSRGRGDCASCGAPPAGGARPSLWLLRCAPPAARRCARSGHGDRPCHGEARWS